MGQQVGWSEDHQDLLIKLSKNGHSAEQTADALCKAGRTGTTRNAVIGKRHRLGIRGPVKVRKLAGPKDPKISVASVKDFRKKRHTVPRQVADGSWSEINAMTGNSSKVDISKIPTHKSKPVLLDLANGQCRWPIGDPKQKGFHFCGMKSLAGKPYCRGHAGASYQAPQPRRFRQKKAA